MLDARRETYLFGPQTFYVPGAAGGNGAFRLRMGTPRQEYVCRIADGAPVTNRYTDATFTFPLPGQKCVEVDFSRPSNDSYTQDFMVSFPKDAAAPYIFAKPFQD